MVGDGPTHRSVDDFELEVIRRGGHDFGRPPQPTPHESSRATYSRTRLAVLDQRLDRFHRSHPSRILSRIEHDTANPFRRDVYEATHRYVERRAHG